MWTFTVALMIIALSGLYMNIDKQQSANANQASSARIADSMAVYRDAVSRYFASRQTEYGSISNAALQAANALPSWYVGPSAAYGWNWANYRGSNGLIYIYATAEPQVNIAADIVKLSDNSILAGLYRDGDANLYSPVYGPTNIPLPPSALAPIPNGSPVWVAYAK